MHLLVLLLWVHHPDQAGWPARILQSLLPEAPGYSFWKDGSKGIHQQNYSDLAIFDLLFGTFYNPKSYEHETGFYPGASAKVWQMLTFQDVNKMKN